jgi:hypothetical protein
MAWLNLSKLPVVRNERGEFVDDATIARRTEWIKPLLPNQRGYFGALFRVTIIVVLNSEGER